MNIKIIEHKYERNGLLQHVALVKSEDYHFTSKDSFVNEVSAQVGFHPLGYGIYGSTYIKPMINENEYLVKWSTGTHCD
jgi:hypothetical protein